MGFRTVKLRFEMKRSDFIHLLLLDGTIKIMAVSTDNKEEKLWISLCGLRNHQKYGPAGTDDRSFHTFQTHFDYEGQNVDALARVNSENGGNTYEGTLCFDYYPADNLSE